LSLESSSSNSSDSSIKTVVDNHDEDHQDGKIVLESSLIISPEGESSFVKTVIAPSTEASTVNNIASSSQQQGITNNSGKILGYSAANLVSTFRSRLLRGLRGVQRQRKNSMEEDLILKDNSGLRSSYGAVTSDDEEEEKRSKHVVQLPDKMLEESTSPKHAMFMQSTPNESTHGEREEDKRKRRKSFSDHHDHSDGHHSHRRRRSSVHRSSLSHDRKQSFRSSRRTSRVDGEEFSLEDLEIDRFSVKPALTWFFFTGRKFLVKYWIWMVALMLMIMSVLGEKVVVFRICYMALFLTFILTFQVSFFS
jgi:hypothetical protein